MKESRINGLECSYHMETSVVNDKSCSYKKKSCLDDEDTRGIIFNCPPLHQITAEGLQSLDTVLGAVSAEVWVSIRSAIDRRADEPEEA